MVEPLREAVEAFRDDAFKTSFASQVANGFASARQSLAELDMAAGRDQPKSVLPPRALGRTA